MRYMTVHDVHELGHEPVLVIGGKVFTFRHRQTAAVIAHDSTPYAAALMIIDMAVTVPAGPFQRMKM
jgi:hypothetical protein